MAAAILDTSGTFFTDSILVRFNASSTPAQQAEAIASIGGTRLKSFSTIPGLTQIGLPNPTASGVPVQNSLNTIRVKSGVQYAEPNYQGKWTAIPNDSRIGEAWAHNNTGQTVNTTDTGTPDADIDSAEAWDISRGSRNTVIAILDSGVEYTHPDLAANMWRNPGEVAGDSIDNDGNGYIDDVFGADPQGGDGDPIDSSGIGHGTHVAGDAAAVGGNGIGVSGTMQVASIMALRVGGFVGPSTTGVLGGLDYITQMKQRGVNVVASNNSYGIGPSQALYDAIKASNDAGIMFIAAAGNSSINIDANPSYPAGYDLPGILSVAASDNDDALATFTNVGQVGVDLAAPGVNILSTFLGGTYSYFSGTSMASPIVAGAVGLVKSARPDMSIAEVKNLLMNTVDVIPSHAGQTVTGGRMNIFRALNSLPKSHIRGSIYSDLANDHVRQPSDPPIAGATVYLDENFNGVYELGETTAATDAAGNFDMFTISRSGTIQIGVLPPANYQFSDPPNGLRTVIGTIGQDIDGVVFGLYGLPGSISGWKFFETNGNAIYEPANGEYLMSNVILYVDLNNDGIIGIGEPAGRTGSNGYYFIPNVPAGTWTVREVAPSGMYTSFPTVGYQTAVVNPNVTTMLVNFVNSPAVDWGDLPAPYATLAADNGARVNIVSGYGLGTSPDPDADGRPSPHAGGDNVTGRNDEDGIEFVTPLTPGQMATLRANISVPRSQSTGYFSGWIDFNSDGDFNDFGEKIVNDNRLDQGTYDFSFRVVKAGNDFKFLKPTYARFRYSSTPGVGPNGVGVSAAGLPAIGEVEDYEVPLVNPTPYPRADAFEVPQFSTGNKFFVLENDTRSAVGNLRILPLFDTTGTKSRNGGTVKWHQNGTPTNFQDDYILYDAPKRNPDPNGFNNVNDVFYYQVSDGVNVSEPIAVNVKLLPADVPAAAIDDLYVIRPNATTTLNVTSNDNIGSQAGVKFPSVRIDRVTQPVGGNGTVTINRNNTPNDFSDDRLVYTPPTGINNRTLQFTYSVNNPGDTAGTNLSTATVTIQIRDNDNTPDANDVAAYGIQVYNVGTGNSIGSRVDVGVAPHTLVQGREYWVALTARDLRAAFNVPGTTTNGNGLFGAFADLGFLPNYVSIPVFAPTTANPLGFEVQYADSYKGAGFKSGTKPLGINGLIDELGVSTTAATIDGPLSQLPVLYVKFRPTALTPGTAGISLFHTDPADQRRELGTTGQSDTILNDSTTGTPTNGTSIQNIAYLRSAAFRIVAATPLKAATTLSAQDQALLSILAGDTTTTKKK